MADPFTLAAIGATAGALTNKDDPLKGAVLGGTLGYGGGAALGLGATQAAAPIASATLAEGAMAVPGLTAMPASMAPAVITPIVPGVGAGTAASMIPGAGSLGMKEYLALNTASGLLGGGQQPQGGGMAMAPMQRGQYQPVITPQSLLATQMDMRRRQPFSFA